MRYVIYGAGAIGGAIGACLHEAGRDAVLIARGDHLATIVRDGLRLLTPDEERVVRVPAVGHPGELQLREDDVVVLAMKTQHTEDALRTLQTCAPPGIAVACAQNGVENERLALRRYDEVYGVCVFVQAAYVEAGVVELSYAPVHGILDVGPAAPGGPDLRAAPIAADLVAAGFDARAVPDVMAWKRTKMLSNIPNAAALACGRGAALDDVGREAVEEALACYRAAGLPWIDEATFRQRRAHLVPRPIAGRPRVGSSVLQSLVRATGNVESDFINGEVALLGRLTGVPTPVSITLQRVAARLAAERRQPGSMSVEELHAEIDACRATRWTPDVAGDGVRS